MKRIDDIQNIKGKRVVVRVDFNVPTKDGKVLNDFRIRAMLPTIEYLRDAGAKTILLAHIDKENVPDDQESLLPVYEYLKNILPLTFVKDFMGDEGKRAVKQLKDGDIVLFDNVRRHEGEESNDEGFAKQLASFGDVYVNEAFSVSHRTHASLVGLPKFLPGFAGFQFIHEVEHLSKAFSPPSPSLVILGGNKFDTKIPLAKKLLESSDTVFVGGALVSEFFREQGFDIGHSPESPKDFGLEEVVGNKHLMLPVDVSGPGFTKAPEELNDGDIILDAGPKTLKMLVDKVRESKFILWNGPIGDYLQEFTGRNETLAKEVARAQAFSVVGGGDTVASIAHLGLEEKITFVSTAGGAMIQFLTDGTLPGIEALKASQILKDK